MSLDHDDTKDANENKINVNQSINKYHDFSKNVKQVNKPLPILLTRIKDDFK